MSFDENDKDRYEDTDETINDIDFDAINNALFDEISTSLSNVEKDEKLIESVKEDISIEKKITNKKSDSTLLSEDELFNDISMSLARQVNQEYDYKPQPNKTEMAKKRKKKKKRTASAVILTIFVAFLLFVALVAFTDLKYSLGGALARVFLPDFNEREKYYTETLKTPDVEDYMNKRFNALCDAKFINKNSYILGLGFDKDEAPQPTPTEFVIDKADKEARHEDYAINVLLLGEEAIGLGGGRGNTDTMIILTLNTVTHEAKMTSMMRDMLISLPNSTKYDRINTVYRRDGIEAVYQAFEENFDIVLDGCVLINFSDFKSIIDILGGVVIELTSEEAAYLQTTNYIADEQYRNVVAGPNHMNGEQALGYCRIRKVATVNNLYADFGRTYRQRTVIQALIDQNDLLSLDFTSIMNIVTQCGDCFFTDISAEQMSAYLKLFIENGISSIEEKRLPESGTYSDTFYDGKEVISINFEKNIRALHEFIFGDYID